MGANRRNDFGNRLNGLDHLRAFAILFVFLYHYAGLFPSPAWLWPVSEFGWSGVDLFFVLSGYLIGGQLLSWVGQDLRIPIRRFYLQRAFRILPAYWAVLALYFLVPAAIERGRLPPLWRFLTFTQNFGLDNRVYGAFSHAWSLCIEEHFYLILPWLITLFVARHWGRRAMQCAGVLMLVGAAIRSYGAARVAAGEGSWSELLYYPTYCHLDGLIVGSAIAGVSIFQPQRWSALQRSHSAVLTGGLGVLVAAYTLNKWGHGLAFAILEFPLVALGYGGVLIAATSPKSFFNRYSAITRRIAVLSYSVYLIHKIVIHLLQETADSLHVASNGVAMFLMCVVATLVCAYFMNAIVERPFLWLRGRLVLASKPDPLAAVRPVS